MVEEVHPQLLKAVQERDKERLARIKFQRMALGLRLQNTRLQNQVRQLTTDKASLSNAAARAKRT